VVVPGRAAPGRAPGLAWAGQEPGLACSPVPGTRADHCKRPWRAPPPALPAHSARPCACPAPCLLPEQLGGSGVLVQPMTYIFNEEPPRWKALLEDLGVDPGSVDIA
jgi:hypothetical protein